MGSGNQLQVMKKRPNRIVRIVFAIRPLHACMPVSVQVVVIPIPGACKYYLRNLLYIYYGETIHQRCRQVYI